VVKTFVSPYSPVQEEFENLCFVAVGLTTFDTQLWVRCMLEESCKLPPLYPDTFGTVAAAILKDIIGLTVHVTHNNCCNVYKSLVRVID